MFSNEVFITPDDKKTIISHIDEIIDVLDKYPSFSGHGNTITTMFRVKEHAGELKKYVNYLYEDILTEQNNMLIDFTRIVSGKLVFGTDYKKGYRVFNKDKQFIGILDEDKTAVWQVDIKTLELVSNIKK